MGVGVGVGGHVGAGVGVGVDGARVACPVKQASVWLRTCVPERAGVWECECGGVLVRMSRQRFLQKKKLLDQNFLSFLFFVVFSLVSSF